MQTKQETKNIVKMSLSKLKKDTTKKLETKSSLDANTIVIVKAFYKTTGEEFTSEMTLSKWYGLKKSKDYFYKALEKR